MRNIVVCLGIAACGGSHHPVAGDGKQPDAVEVDAARDVPASGPVTVTVYDFSHAPAPGMQVVFQNADDSIVASTTTDAQGAASAVMLAGGSVSATQPLRPGTDGLNPLYTFIAVEPGDQLVIGEPPTAMSFQVSFAIPAVAGTSDYHVTTRCGQQGVTATAPVTVTVDVSCDTSDVYVAVTDMQGNTSQAFVESGVALAAGATIDLSGETYRPLHDVSLTVSNIPAGLFNMLGEAEIAMQTVGLEAHFYSGTSPTLDQTVQLSDIPDLNFVMTAEMTDSATSAEQQIVQVAPYQASDTLDIAATSLPWVTGPVPDAAAHTLSWTETGSGSADYLHTVFSVTRSSGTRFLWNIAGPHTGTTLKLPALPPPLDEYNLQPNEMFAEDSYIARFPGGWRVARPNVFNVTSFVSVLAATGVAAVSWPAFTSGFPRRQHLLPSWVLHGGG